MASSPASLTSVHNLRRIITDKTKITSAQFFGLIYLSMLVGVFLYMSNTSSLPGSSDSILRPIVFGILNMLLMLPMLFYVKIIGSEDVFSFLEKKSELLSRIAAALYCISFLLGITGTAARFDIFASSVMFYETDMSFFVAVMLFVCVLISGFGLGAIARSGIIFTVLVSLGTAAVIITALLNGIDFLNFTPLFNETPREFFSDRFGFSYFCTELSALLIFLPKIEGNIKKSYFKWVVGSGVVMCTLAFSIVGSLGAFANSQLFPVYAVSSVGGIGIVDRVDSLETALWMLCVVIKISFQLIVFEESFRRLFKTKSKRFAPFAASALAAGVVFWVSYDIKRFAFLSDWRITVIPFLVLAVLLPLMCVIMKKRGESFKKAS